MLSRPFFARALQEQLFELKNEDDIEKSENLRDTCACQGLSINTMHGPIQSCETVPLSAEFTVILQSIEKFHTYYSEIFKKSAVSVELFNFLDYCTIAVFS
jgi:hypothetical protein